MRYVNLIFKNLLQGFKNLIQLFALIKNFKFENLTFKFFFFFWAELIRKDKHKDKPRENQKTPQKKIYRTGGAQYSETSAHVFGF
jgi:hypothetical protein